MELVVNLGEFVLVNDAGVVEIAQRALVDNVAHGEALDGLVLGGLAAAAVADDEVGVAAAVAVAAVVATFHGHGAWRGGGGGKEKRRDRGVIKRESMPGLRMSAGARGRCAHSENDRKFRRTTTGGVMAVIITLSTRKCALPIACCE